MVRKAVAAAMTVGHAERMWWRRRREVGRDELPSEFSEELVRLPSWAAQELTEAHAETRRWARCGPTAQALT
jgi:hypothetical protein